MSYSQDSARSARAITPSDSVVFAQTRGIYIGGAGNLAVRLSKDDDAVVHENMLAGVYYPIEAVQVLSTGTTATGIVGWY